MQKVPLAFHESMAIITVDYMQGGYIGLEKQPPFPLDQLKLVAQLDPLKTFQPHHRLLW